LALWYFVYVTMPRGTMPRIPRLLALIAGLCVALGLLACNDPNTKRDRRIPVVTVYIGQQEGQDDSSLDTLGILAEADSAFTYNGDPIHPFGVRDLLQWTSDSHPGPVAVDLAGIYESNRYFGEWSVDADGGTVVAKYNTATGMEGEEDKGYFAYRLLARLPNGWHVLRTRDAVGGSGEFEMLLLVRFRADQEFGDSVRVRVLMERRGMVKLGDRYEGRILIHGDSVTVTADSSSHSDGTGNRTFVFHGLR
jgi:hypothetical protein